MKLFAGGGYQVFAGKEVARALGKMVISEAECSDKLDDLTDKELGTLKDWEQRFEDKYTVVGQVGGWEAPVRVHPDPSATFDRPVDSCCHLVPQEWMGGWLSLLPWPLILPPATCEAD